MYDENRKKATIKYVKTLKRVELRFTQREYNEEIAPAIEASGLPVATYIRQALKEKIIRDKAKK